jgi:KDO2-lipid IV(A) lauroyltransferase
MVRDLGGAVFVGGGALGRLLPSSFRYGFAGLGGRATFRLVGRTRRQALENYAGILHQGESSPEVRRVAREALVGYAKLLADFVLMPSLTPQRVREMVDWDGIEHIHRAREGGKGVIVVTPHFGNWDIAAAATTALGLPVTAVTERHGTSDLNRRVVEARQRIGMNVVPLGVTAGKAVLTALRRNELVALVCDLPPKEGRSVRVRICGQDALVPAGPALLALRSGAPVVPFVCRRLPDDRYRVEVQPPLRFEATDDKDRDVERLAQAIMDRFDPILRAAPEQWYLFSPMWHHEGQAAAESTLAVAG